MFYRNNKHSFNFSLSMKIIFCDNGMNMLLNFRIDIIEHFLRKGNEVILIYPRTTHKEELIRKIPQGCRYMCVDVKPTGTNPFSDLKYLLELYKVYRREKPDVIFHYTIKPNIYGTIAALMACIKCRVSMVAGLGYVFNGNGLSKNIARLLYKAGLRLSSKVITLNSHNCELLVNGGYVKNENMFLFEGGEGVNLTKFHYKENQFDELHFLMVARVLYDKGYEEFVEAAKNVKKHYPNVSFELLGPIDEDSPMGVPFTTIKKDVEDGYIDYLGTSDDVPSILGRNGVVSVLISSYNEGMNRSLMEALAMGRPIITSNIPGCKELVNDGVNGYTVPPKNSVALADAIIRFIELSEHEKQSMAISSYKLAIEKFDVTNVIKNYDRIVEDFVTDKL